MPDIQVDVGHAAFLPALLAGAGVDAASRAEIGAALAARDLVAVEAALAAHRAGRRPSTRCCSASRPCAGGASCSTRRAHGLEADRARCARSTSSPGSGTCSASARLQDRVHLDLGAVRDWNYYTGPTFELFSGDVGFPLGAGGRYDSLLGRFGLRQPATGFVVHADRCHDAVTRRREAAAPRRRRRAAHRRAHRVRCSPTPARCCANSGVAPGLRPESFERRLQLPAGGHEVITVRPTDVPVYVEMGACDCGIVGKDVLWELRRELYEIADLRFGGCRLVLAAPEGSALATGSWPAALRVATKYPQAARRFFAGRGDGAELIRLHGSVELAPSAGLSDGIVDLVATGATLRANRLCEVATIATSTARLVVNVASMKTRSAAITELATTLRRTVEEGSA